MVKNRYEEDRKISLPSLKRLFKDMIKAGGWRVPLALVAAILGSIATVFSPLIMSNATTSLFEGFIAQLNGSGGIDFDYVGRILLIVVGVNVFSTIFKTVQGRTNSTITEGIVYELRTRLIRKVNMLPMAYFEDEPVGESLSIIVNDTETLSNALAQTLSNLVSSIINVIGMGIVIIYMSPPMALIVLLTIPISLFLVKKIVKHTQKFFNRQQRILGNLTGKIEESYAGINVIQGFNQEDENIEDFEKINDKLRENGWKALFYSGILFPFMNVINNFSYVLVVIVGAYLTLRGSLEIGQIQAFIQYSNRFFNPIATISQSITLLQNMSAAAERIYGFLDMDEEDQYSGDHLEVDQVEGYVGADHVHFGYDPDQIILNDLNLTTEPGQKVAIVGPTGAGKSTIVKLLMRFYDVNSGKICLDGTDIEDYSRTSYQQVAAMVLQDTWLFKGSIMENVRYGRLDASDEEVIEACKAAGVHDYIMEQDKGYDFKINEDASNLSQGQKQLLTIARALIADRPILILDEATSSVDTRTEMMIQKAMDELMKGRTSFVIAHRLSTIKNADTILYMEDGDIVEKGNHQELMDLGGKYAALYNSQFAA